MIYKGRRMSRKVLSSLFLSLALVAPLSAQDVFVPRELKAQAAHSVAAKDPVKSKEAVRRADPASQAELKAPAKPPTVATSEVTEKPAVPAPKNDKAVASKEKSTVSPAVKPEKVPGAANPEPKKIAKAETIKAEPTKEKSEKASAEKKVAAKPEQPAEDVVATIKVAKTPATKAVAKVETPNADSKKEKVAQPKDPADTDVPTIKVEKAAVSRESALASKKTIAKTEAAKPETAKEKGVSAKEKPSAEVSLKTAAPKSETAVAKVEKAPKNEVHNPAPKADGVQIETVTAKTEKTVAKEKPATVAVTKPHNEEKIAAAREESPKAPAAKVDPAKPALTVTKPEKPAAAKDKAPAIVQAKPENATKAELPAPREGPAVSSKLFSPKPEIVSIASQKEPVELQPAVSSSLDTGFTKIADGFDFPVGKPEAEGYYKARGFRPNGHLGEDWDGTRGGDTDLRDPIYSIGDGIVVFARDVHLGWGNVIIVRHAYRDGGNVKYIDALYGHLNTMLVGRGQRVTRGQQIATMGNAHGRYDAHLHFEIRKNLEIGMSRSKFSKDFSNYYDPTQFIAAHRHLSGGGANYKVAMNTFTHDWMYHFDSNQNFPVRKRSTSESSAALRKALSSR